MPPASKTRGRGGGSGGKQLSRSFKVAAQFQETLLHSQLAAEGEESAALRDTRLVTSDGWLDVHAPLLTALSPFLAKCIDSQGDSYSDRRSILLLDWSLGEIGPLIQLIYTGSVSLSSEEDVTALRGLLAFFEIEIQDDLSTKKISSSAATSSSAPPPTIRSHKRGTTPPPQSPAPPIPPPQSANTSATTVPVSVVASSTSNGGGGGGRTLRPRDKRGEKRPLPRNYNDSDWEPDTEEEEAEAEEQETPEEEEEEEAAPPPPNKVAKIVGQPQVSPATTTLAQNINCAAAVKEGGAATTAANKKKKGGGGGGGKGAVTGTGGNWVEPNYKDKDWFDSEARKCQFCSKEFSGPSEASLCITGHARLRCYFCFKVCSNTEKLFDHFKKRHKQAGRENSLICPFCEQAIPYKSVSCHVISIHLADPKASQRALKDKETSGSSTAKAGESSNNVNKSTGSGSGEVGVAGSAKGGRGRPPTTTTIRTPVVLLTKTPTPGPSPAKKAKKKEEEAAEGPPILLYETVGGEGRGGRIRPKNLDLTIRRVGLDGKMWVWRIQRDYQQPLRSTHSTSTGDGEEEDMMLD